MKKDRFTIEPDANDSIRWTVKDNVSGVSVAFYEGCFLDRGMQQVPDSLKGEDKEEELQRIGEEITAWVGENALDIAVCNVSARCRALWLLNDSHSMAVIAKAIIDISPDDIDVTNASVILISKVNDYVLAGDGEDEFCYDQELTRFFGAVSMLSDKEAMELFCMASVYWNHKAKAGIDVNDFANDLLLWPVRLSREQQADSMGNDSKFIEAEGFEFEEEKK